MNKKKTDKLASIQRWTKQKDGQEKDKGQVNKQTVRQIEKRWTRNKKGRKHKDGNDTNNQKISKQRYLKNKRNKQANKKVEKPSNGKTEKLAD